MKVAYGYLLDTNAVISIMKNEPEEEAVSQFAKPWFMTVLHYAELQEVAAKKAIFGSADEVYAWMQASRIRLVDLDRASAEAVGQLRRSWRESPGFADICLLGHGLAHGFRLLTRDKDWAGLDLPKGLHVQTIGGPKGSRPPPAAMPKLRGRQRR